MADSDPIWKSLIHPPPSFPGVAVMTFASLHRELKTYDIQHPFFGPAFLRATDLVIRLTLTGQDALARPLAAELAPYALAVAGAAPGTDLDVLDRSNVATVALIDLFESMDWKEFLRPGAGLSHTAPLDRIGAMTRHGDGMVASVVLALLAHDRTGEAQDKAGLEPISPFVRACLSGRAQDAWPAWRDAFPAAVAANTVFWHQLLFVIRLLAPKDANPADWLRAEVG
jgi:hypothetical protein